MMDIRRKTTYFARAHDGRSSHNYSSFFHSAHKKNQNNNPDSGVHLVGPMFELTACAELKEDEEVFEARYPDSSLTYGPTICSFGFKYNDHNYALPSGLTPPSMAPHLMDLQVPRNKFGYSKVSSSISCAKNIFGVNSSSKWVGVLDKNTDRQSSVEGVKFGDGSGSNNDNSNNNNHDNANSKTSWYSRSGNFGENGLPEDDHTVSSRYGLYEQMELRCEPELKVIEVPEELAVSPSQLSDLDSDLSDVEYSNKVVIPGRLSVHGNASGPAESHWPSSTSGNSSNWSEIHCLCGQMQSNTQLIQCSKCSTYQHVRCMEVYYSISVPQLTECYICSVCNGEEDPNYRSQLEKSQSVRSDVDSSVVKPDQKLLGTGDVESTEAFQTGPKVAGEGNIGAQYVELTADRAKRLGLISTPKVAESGNGTAASGSWTNLDKPASKEHDYSGRSGWGSVNWDKLNEISRSSRRNQGDTNVNLRMPSPPRASKRKQDLTSTSYNDADVATTELHMERSTTNTSLMVNSGDDLSSADLTPSTTPSSTPNKMGQSALLTPSTPVSTPGYSSSSGVEGSPRRPHTADRFNHKAKRVLFPDGSSHVRKRRFDTRTNVLGAAWAKDYREADNSLYTKALLDYINTRISSNLERNHRIPPSCLTRSSLCRVVLFDHTEKGLEAAIRLSANEVVIEVRGNFSLMEEYEHYVDPVSEYNRYVMFYRSLGDRTVVVDASHYGNHARFVRRSCMPNCRLEHYIVQNKLQIVIRTSVEIMPGTELTIPFDLDYRACRYPLDCACARSRCPVLKWRRKLLRNKVVPNLDYSKYIESQLRVLSKPLSQESPNSRGATPFDSPTLTGPPLVKSSVHLSGQSTTVSPSSQLSSSVHNKFDPPSTGKAQSDADLTSSTSKLTKANEDVSDIAVASTDESVDGSSRVLVDNRPDEKVVGDCFDNTVVSDKSNIAKQKDDCRTQASEGVDEKMPFEPIITTRRQAAARKNVLR